MQRKKLLVYINPNPQSFMVTGLFKDLGNDLVTEGILVRLSVPVRPEAKKAIEKEFLNAIYLGKVDDVRKCIKKRVNVNMIDPENEKYTALHICAEKGDDAVGKVLIAQNSININAQSTYLNTPLMLAVIFKMIHFVRLLLRSGANPNIINYAGKSPLHVAVQKDYHIVVELLSYKAQVNVIDQFDNTPLSLCVIETPSRLIAKCLLKNGANPNLRTMKANPLLNDLQVGQANRLRIVLELALNCNSQEHLQLVKLLLEFNADPNITNRISHQTPLHMASLISSVLLAKLLISMGANPNARDLLNRTPADLAVDHYQADMIYFYKHRKGAPQRPPSESDSKPEFKPSIPISGITSEVFKNRKSVKFSGNDVKSTPSNEEF